jgi:hypothetical protein
VSLPIALLISTVISASPAEQVRALEVVLDEGRLEEFVAQASSVAIELAQSEPKQADRLFEQIFWANRRLMANSEDLASAILKLESPPPLAAALSFEIRAQRARSRNDSFVFQAALKQALERIKPLLEDEEPFRRGAAHLVAAMVAGHRGNALDDRKHLDAALAAFNAGGKPRLVLRATLGIAFTELNARRADEAQGLLETVVTSASASNLPLLKAMALRLLGGVHQVAQRPAESAEALYQATTEASKLRRWELATEACLGHIQAATSTRALVPVPGNAQVVPRVERRLQPGDCFTFASRIIPDAPRLDFSVQALFQMYGDVLGTMLERELSGNRAIFSPTVKYPRSAPQKQEIAALRDVLRQSQAAMEGAPNAPSAVVANMRALRAMLFMMLRQYQDVVHEARAAEVLYASMRPVLEQWRVENRHRLIYALVRLRQWGEATEALQLQLEERDQIIKDWTWLRDQGQLPPNMSKENVEQMVTYTQGLLDSDLTYLAEILEESAGLPPHYSRQPDGTLDFSVLQRANKAGWLPAAAAKLSQDAQNALQRAGVYRAKTLEKSRFALGIFWMMRVQAFRGDYNALEEWALRYVEAASTNDNPRGSELLTEVIARLPQSASKARARLQCRLGKEQETNEQAAFTAYQACYALADPADPLAVEALFGMADSSEEIPERANARVNWLREVLKRSTGSSPENVEKAADMLVPLLFKRGEVLEATNTLVVEANAQHELGSHKRELVTLDYGVVAAFRSNCLECVFLVVERAKAAAAKDSTWAELNLTVRVVVFMGLKAKSPADRKLIYDMWSKTPLQLLSEPARLQLNVLEAVVAVAAEDWSRARTFLDQTLPGAAADDEFYFREELFRTVQSVAANSADGAAWYYQCLATMAAPRLRTTANELLSRMGQDGSGLADPGFSEKLSSAVRGWTPKELGFEPDLRWPPRSTD